MVRSGGLTVIGDQPPSALRDVAIQMEQFRSVVSGLIRNAGQPLALPTVVFVFGARKSFQPFLPLYQGKPVPVAGLFLRSDDMNSIVLSLEDFEESSAVLYHEYTHLLLANAVQTLPVWLSEGLADYYGSYLLRAGAKSADIGRPQADRVRLLRERYLPLSDLIAVDHSSPYYNERDKQSIFYAESWALTHMLLTQPGGATTVNNYWTAVATGKTPDAAFAEAFGSTPKAFDSRLQDYVRRPVLNGIRYTFSDTVRPPEVSAPRQMTPAEADAWLGDLQRRVGRADEAARRIEAAVRAEPSTPMVHVALGLLKRSQDKFDEGTGALRRAAEMAPGDFLTQFVLGVSLLRAGAADRADGRAEARAALARAVAARPDSAEALAWLAYVQMLDDATLGEARTSIERALAIAPGRLDYTLRWADVRILLREEEAARRVLEQVAAVRTDPAMAARARARLDTLDRTRTARSGGSSPTPRNFVSIEVPADSTVPADSGRLRLQLRDLMPGERRTAGLLTRIDCAASGVTFRVAAGAATIVATAPKMEDVALISYLTLKDFTVACGPHEPPDFVLITVAGDIVKAVEFVPKDYVP
jgi:Flp pilus assembly protein TadD